MRFTYQSYVLLVFSILVSFFLFAGGDISTMLSLLGGIWGVPDIIKYPLILLFLILTWFAWNDFKQVD